MHVGDEANAQPGKRCGKSGDWQRRRGELEVVPAVQETVRASACDRADAGRGKRLEDGAAGQRHTLIY